MIAQRLPPLEGVYDPPEKALTQIRHDTNLPPIMMHIVRHQSFGSCYSTRSVVSSATGLSTKSHRRCHVEVGSILFGNPGGCFEHTTESVETFAKNRRAIRSRQGSIHTTDRWHCTGSEQFPSKSHISRMCVPSDVTLGSAASTVKKGKGKHQGGILDHAREVDLIRQLSFSPSVSKKSSSPVEEVASSLDGVLLNETSQCDRSALDVPLDFEKEEDEILPAPTSPPLLPMIMRLKLLEIPVLSNQDTRNRSRTQSASVSEMSESFIDELGDIGNDASFHSSGEEFNEVTEEKSLITIDYQTSSALILARRPASCLQSRDRTPTFASDQSSYVSPCSSCDITLNHFGEGEETEDQDDVVNCEHMFGHNTVFHFFAKDVNCNAPSYDRDNDVTDVEVLRPRLNSETLRRWNIFCEEEESKKEIITKNQLIFRGTIYPNKSKDILSPEREKTSLDIQDDENNSVKELGLPLARSFFSYTNSYSSLRTFSQSINDEDGEISDLDFDMGFTSPDSLVTSSSIDGVELNMSHKRNRIYSLLGISSRLLRRSKSV